MDRGWAVLAGVAAAATGLVAAFGGFAPAAEIRPAEPGAVLELQRWDLTVKSAELVGGDADHEPEIRVWFTVVNTAQETQSQPWGLVSLVLPDRTIEADDWTIPNRSGGFDPDVALPAYVSAPATGSIGGQKLKVQLFDEHRSDTPAPIEVWSVTGPVAEVAVALSVGAR